LRRGVTDTLTYNRDLVKEKMGVYPNQVVDYKALAGDSSDNIPGAPGFGPKTAADLLSKYETLEGVYDHLEELSERHRRILEENKDQVFMSRRLAAIRLDLKIDLDLKQADIGNFDFSKAIGFFHEMGFKSLLTKLPKAENRQQANLFAGADPVAEQPKVEEGVTPQLPFEAITTLKRWEELRTVLGEQQYLVIDTETVDLGGELLGIAFGWGPEDSAYLPLAPAYPGGLPLEKIKSDLQEILRNPEIKKIGHNLKYDLHILADAGLPVAGAWFDTMIASQLVNTQLFSHRLDDLAFAELGFKKISITELIGKKKEESMKTVPLDTLAAYSCEDALITWRLFEHLRPDLEEKSVKRVFYEIEMPLMPVLVQMERFGIAIDQKHLEKLGDTMREHLIGLEKKIRDSAGQDFNVNSPSQLQEILFTKLKLPTQGIKKVQSGHSTDAESLQKLREAHPMIGLLLEYREMSKLFNTYVETLPKLADQHGVIHTSYQQIGAATGRMASINPNLQNIPVKSELGQEVRRAFVARPGWVLLAADYSQIELRILAHLSEDPGLIAAFQQGDDFHAAVSAQLGVDRRAAKAINFGIVYGLGAAALGNDLGITQAEAKAFIDRYFQTFPKVAAFIEAKKEEVRRQGFVETLFGRRRYLPDIASPNMGLRSAAERMAVNMPCQGTQADLIKMAMIRLGEVLDLEQSRMLLQIHDELLLEVRPKALEAVGSQVRQVMSEVTELRVPIEVGLKTGSNWADLAALT
jgi:DNA polymerase-1